MSPGSPSPSPSRAERLPGLSVVVPTYRSVGTLERLRREVEQEVGPLCDELELIFVDDGNADGTWDEVVRMADQHRWVRGVRLFRNYGQHNALLAGLAEASLPFVVTLDDDLQLPPSEVAALVSAMTDDVDLVYGTSSELPQSRLRNVASSVTKWLMARLLGPDVFERSSAFRLFRRDLLVVATGLNDPFVSIDVMLSWATSRVRSVEVRFDRRAEGESGYTVRRLVRHAFNMITGYSTRPLRTASALGFIFSSVGFTLLAFVVIQFLLGGREVPGFAFLAATVALFSGVQLLSLGVLGEYLARVHVRSMGRPPFAVRERIPR